MLLERVNVLDALHSCPCTPPLAQLSVLTSLEKQLSISNDSESRFGLHKEPKSEKISSFLLLEQCFFMQ